MDAEHFDENSDEENINNDDSEEIPLTAAQVIKIMEEAWLNEKFAPEILPHKSEIVDCLLGQISYMEENLQNLNSGDFQKNLHQMEIDRLRFVISSYIRTRLEKIETYVFSILKAEEQRGANSDQAYLTANEFEFARSYSEGIEQHFEEVLKFWPGLPPNDWKKELLLPNMHSFVFAKSKENIAGVMIDDADDDEEAVVDLRMDSQMIMSYNSIAQLVKNDQVYLI